MSYICQDYRRDDEYYFQYNCAYNSGFRCPFGLEEYTAYAPYYSYAGNQDSQ